MHKNLFLWNDPHAFSTGVQENVCITDRFLALERAGGRYLHAGCFTTEEVPCAAFRKLVASWNSDTPVGTAIEVQARVRAQGTWSGWLSWGKWSPFVRRASVPGGGAADRAQVTLDTDVLTVNGPGPGADAFQLRVFLYADHDATATPTVALLGASVLLSAAAPDSGEPLNRSVPVPAYSQCIREPRIAGSICSPTTIAMLMNRFGEDVLPEEAALNCYDAAYQGYGNWSFSTALAGCYGYTCYVCYTDIAALKYEIKHGHACGVSVRYTNNPTVAQEKGLPYMAGTTGTTEGHLMVVRGFSTDEDGTEFVLVNDSFSCCDAAAQRRYRLTEFAQAWTGVAYLLHEKQPRASLCPPQRVSSQLRRGDLPDEFALYIDGERHSLPADFSQQGDTCTGCVCCALHEGHAYATTAHKCFFYGNVSASGNLVFDTHGMPTGTKFTVFLVGCKGRTDVAELVI